MAGVAGAGVVLCACSERITGASHALTSSGGASTLSRAAAAQPTPSPTYSQAGGSWVDKSDPDALIEFRMPGQPTVTSQTGYAKNGEYQAGRPGRCPGRPAGRPTRDLNDLRRSEPVVDGVRPVALRCGRA